MESYRKAMGEKLKEYRLSRNLTAYRVAKDGGIRIDQVGRVESGDKNYTIDVLNGYCRGCGLVLRPEEADKAENGA